MKKHIILTLALLVGVAAMAQEEEPVAKDSHWHSIGHIGLNFSQGTFTNWAAGGQNTLAWLGTFDYSINYAKESFKWNNTLNTSLGYSYFDFKQKPVKTDDIFEFTSLAGLRATETLHYSAELAFRSQCAKGFDYDTDSTNYISKFLAPGYLSLGLGMEWEPNDYFSLNFAPLTGRLTIVLDTALAARFGFEPELDPYDENEHVYHQTRFEFGARAVARFQYPIFNNVDFSSKLELFSNYLKDPHHVDVDWQNLLVMKVNSWLNCNIGTHLIYDYDIPFYDLNPATGDYELDPNSKIQFKEVLSIGLLFKL